MGRGDDAAASLRLEELAALIAKSAIAPMPSTFADLPRETQSWLKDLRPEDITEIREAVDFMRDARTVGRFGKWMLITIVATFGAAIAFGEKLQLAAKWLVGSAVK